MRAIVSTTSISRPTRSSLGAGSFAYTQEGSKLDADHPSIGVKLARRNTPFPQGGP
jgi:hypothetical protein